MQVEIARNDTTLGLAADLRKKRGELKTKYNNISSQNREELEKLLPDTVDNVRLIIDIDNIAEQYGIVIRDFEISSTEDQEKEVKVIKSEFEGIIDNADLEYADTSKVGVISFSFSVTSQYDVFNRFLQDLEEALRIVDVRSVEISSSGDDSVFYDYRVNLDTYWLK